MTFYLSRHLIALPCVNRPTASGTAIFFARVAAPLFSSEAASHGHHFIVHKLTLITGVWTYALSIHRSQVLIVSANLSSPPRQMR